MPQIDRYIFRIALLCIAIAGFTLPVPSKAFAPADEEWRASDVEALPSEVSKEVYEWRGARGLLTARSTISRITEIYGRRCLALHFEQLRCEDRAAICSASGCLHETYAFRRGGFHKVISLRTSELQIGGSSDQVRAQIAKSF
jgi:hypothetical protein